MSDQNSPKQKTEDPAVAGAEAASVGADGARRASRGEARLFVFVLNSSTAVLNSEIARPSLLTQIVETTVLKKELS